GVAVGVGHLAHAVTPKHVLRRGVCLGPPLGREVKEGVHVITVNVKADWRTNAGVNRGLPRTGLGGLWAPHGHRALPDHLGMSGPAIRPGEAEFLGEAEGPLIKVSGGIGITHNQVRHQPRRSSGTSRSLGHWQFLHKRRVDKSWRREYPDE